VFISFEGTEGTGKSTQISYVFRELTALGYKVFKTHEPGGTFISEEIRKILLDSSNTAMTPITELLLYNAARHQHIQEKIIPALQDNIIVLTDRFSDSTIAYQGYGRGIGLDIIMAMDDIATKGLRPDITFLLDINDPVIGLKRNSGIKKIDRFELEEIEFHKRVRQGFLKIAQMDTKRFIILDGNLAQGEISNQIITIIKDTINVSK
jgi:dTMP kinase